MGPLGKRGGYGAGGRAEEEPAAVTWVCASSTPQALMFHALFFMHVRQKVMKQRFLKKKKKGRPPRDWEKVFANHLYDKGLISRIRKELLQLNNNKEQKPDFKNGHRS